MSVVDALIDYDSKYCCFHDEVRDVVKKYKHNEKFTVIGELCIHSITSVGQGDPGYYANVYDRIDKRLYINVFISEGDYEDILDEQKDFVTVCVWVRKIIMKKQVFYQTFLIRRSNFMDEFDML